MLNLRAYIILLLALCNISIRANLRGWTTSLSSPVFQQSLYYNTTLSGGIPQFDGSLSAMTFSSINSSGTPEYFSVTYGYDDFDRLASVNSITAADTQKIFSESFSYDENGNPLVITRGNANTTPIQYISLSYDGNRISSLNESKPIEGLYPEIASIAKGDYETGWSYDANGNRTADPSRGITSITYNSYNSPLKITFDDGSYIQHNYRSDGTAVGRTEREAEISTVNGGSNTAIRYTYRDIHRIGDFELRSTVPKRVYIDNGYIDLDYPTRTYAYNYYIHDNQGSVRVVIGENGAIKQATDYSAYGVPSTRYAGTANNNHLHLGLEWQAMKGLSGYYNNARFRDALLAGMFYQQDPLAEKYYSFSPYHYGAGNPVKFTDETGKFIETVWDAISLTTGVVSLYNNIVSGNYVDAVADGVGVIVDAAAVLIPGVPGGAGAAIKASRAVDNLADGVSAIEQTSKIVHGNSKASTKAQHAYDIIEIQTGKRVKTGVSGGKIRKDGKSYRAEQQVRALNKKAGYKKYESEVVHKIPAGKDARTEILKYEQERATELWQKNEIDPKIHKIPKQ